MAQRLAYLAEIDDEIAAALAWYHAHSPALAERFYAELRATLDKVRLHPLRFRRNLDGTRRAILDSFPYMVVYLALDAKVVVVAVAHAHRRPGYWRRRLPRT